MKTELLIIKTGDGYIRVKEGRYLRCKLDKASVFPMTQLETVQAHVQTLKNKPDMNPKIYKLILKEEPFSAS